MDERTVNGKSLSTVSDELTAQFPQDRTNWGYAVGNDGREYPAWIRADAYERRLNEVLGLLNYSREATESRIITLGEASYAVTKVTLTIYDDSGSVVAVKSANGSSALGNGDLKSNLASAESEAIKQLCHDMGLGAGQMHFVSRKQKLETAKSKSRYPAAPPVADAAPVAPYAAGQQVTGSGNERGVPVVVTLSSMFANGNGHVYADAVDNNGNPVKVKIFKNVYPEIERAAGKPFASFVSEAIPGTKLRFRGEYKEYNGTTQVTVWSAA